MSGNTTPDSNRASSDLQSESTSFPSLSSGSLGSLEESEEEAVEKPMVPKLKTLYLVDKVLGESRFDMTVIPKFAHVQVFHNEEVVKDEEADRNALKARVRYCSLVYGLYLMNTPTGHANRQLGNRRRTKQAYATRSNVYVQYETRQN